MWNWQGHENPVARLEKRDFQLQLFAGQNDGTMNVTMMNKAKQIRQQMLENGPVWKPGSLEKHVNKRKRRGHIPKDWTDEDYNNKILQILSDANLEIYLHHFERYSQYFFAYGLPDWLVIVGEDGIMETAYLVDEEPFYSHLSTENGFFRLNQEV